MAYRISFNGFHLKQMKELFGSGNRDAFQSIRNKLATEYSYLARATTLQVLQSVSDAIHKGVPFHDLECEDDTHSFAASLLAQHEQDWHFTYCDYHWTSLQPTLQFARKCGGPMVQGFFNLLWEGTPIFGPKSCSNQSPYYAYFPNSKLPGIIEEMDLLHEVAEMDAENENLARFLSDVRGWLVDIEQKKMDCWFETG